MLSSLLPHATIASMNQTFKKLAIKLSFPAFMMIARFFPFERLPVVCAFRRSTGLQCPSCGLTRSVADIANLRFMHAIHLHPFGPLFVAFCAIWWGASLYEIATGRKAHIAIWAQRRLVPLVICAFVALMAFGVIRIWLLLH